MHKLPPLPGSGRGALTLHPHLRHHRWHRPLLEPLLCPVSAAMPPVLVLPWRGWHPTNTPLTDCLGELFILPSEPSTLQMPRLDQARGHRLLPHSWTSALHFGAFRDGWFYTVTWLPTLLMSSPCSDPCALTPSSTLHLCYSGLHHFPHSPSQQMTLGPISWKDNKKIFKRKLPWLSSQGCCPFIYEYIFTPTLFSLLHLPWLLSDTKRHPVTQTIVLLVLSLLLLPSWPVHFDQQNLTKLPFSLPYPTQWLTVISCVGLLLHLPSEWTSMVRLPLFPSQYLEYLAGPVASCEHLTPCVLLPASSAFASAYVFAPCCGALCTGLCVRSLLLDPRSVPQPLPALLSFRCHLLSDNPTNE